VIQLGGWLATTSANLSAAMRVANLPAAAVLWQLVDGLVTSGFLKHQNTRHADTHMADMQRLHVLEGLGCC
jgi:hypothetical protein